MSDIQRFEQLKKNIEFDPANFQARREFAMLCSDMGFNEVAIKHFSFLSEIFKEDSNLYFNIGICFEKLKEFEIALEYYKKAVEINPEDCDFIYNYALCLESLDKNDEAIRQLKRVICMEKNDSNSFFVLGCLYSKKNEIENAVKCFKKTISLNKNDYYAHFHLANMYHKQGLLDENTEKLLSFLPIILGHILIWVKFIIRKTKTTKLC